MNTIKTADAKTHTDYKNSGSPWLGDMPEHWRVERLSTSVETQINGVWGSDPNGTDDLPCIRVADFDRENHRIRTDKLTLRSVKPSERAGRILRKGDLLLEKSGGGEQQPVGTVMLYDHDFQAVCSNFVGRMVLREGYDPTYLTYLHATLYAIGVNKRSIKQTTGIQNIDSSSYLSELVGIPPLAEQAAIAQYLDEAEQQIQAYISTKDRLIALLEEQRQAIIHQAVTRGLDPNVRLKPSGVEWLGDVPGHWEVRDIKSIAKIKRGKFTHRPRNDPSLYDGPYPFIQTGDIATAGRVIKEYKQTLNQRGLAVSTMFPSGTLVMTIAANIGDVAILNFDSCFPDSIVGIIPVSTTDRNYLYHLLGAMRDELLREAPVNTQGNLNVGRIGSMKVPIPDFEEQTVIAEYLDQAMRITDDKISYAERLIELIEEYRTRLIADVVTGKLDVRNAAEELPQPEPA